jgi:hypothetical protein
MGVLASRAVALGVSAPRGQSIAVTPKHTTSRISPSLIRGIVYDAPQDQLGDLGHDGVAESSKSVDTLARRHLFAAFLRPNSDKQAALHVLCFLLWRGVKGVPQMAQFFVSFDPTPQDPSATCVWAWHV